ncbi:thiamine phosphate synthase [Carnimonas bestiolae]|uniref:thiamine phosphate synthase n=1 Tax=Carnimonas bestiolae TaxID=3402172 RepID=UPI003EDB8B34
MNNSGWQRGIYAITDAHLMPDDDTLFSRVAAALEGGIALLQYRDKSVNQQRRLRQAQRLKQLCDHYDTPLIINDDVDLAKAVNAGVHLGREDGSIAAARAQLGASAIIGATCHDSLESAAQAVDEGASYLAFGRFFASRTKPDAPPAPLTLLREARQWQLPVVAIGGIDSANIGQVIDAGADLAAVVHAVFGSSSPAHAVFRLRQAVSD